MRKIFLQVKTKVMSRSNLFTIVGIEIEQLKNSAPLIAQFQG